MKHKAGLRISDVHRVATKADGTKLPVASENLIDLSSNENTTVANTERSSDHHHNRTAITEECDFPGIDTLTALKVCTNYEYHREAALEGYEPARIRLLEEYPGWDRLPWKMVSVQLRQERIAALAQQESSAAISQMVPDSLPDNLLELAQEALASFGLPLITPVPSATPLQLATIEGLIPEKYLEFINSKRGGIASQLAILNLDWSLPDETMVDNFRCLLRIARPRDATGQSIPAIHHEKGKGSTYRQLRVILNALIAYRLLKRGGLSVPEAIRTLEKAHIKVPYTQNREQRWRDAEILASHFLKKLKAGRFVEAVQKFVRTQQARKIFGAPI